MLRPQSVLLYYLIAIQLLPFESLSAVKNFTFERENIGQPNFCQADQNILRDGKQFNSQKKEQSLIISAAFMATEILKWVIRTFLLFSKVISSE